jgi:hypothetical protein
VRVYRAILPKRTGNRLAILRVVSETSRYLTIRLTAMPSDPTLKVRMWTVAREDLELMIATKLATPLTSLRCADCGSMMTIHEGWIGRTSQRPCYVFACSGCESCLEI